MRCDSVAVPGIWPFSSPLGMLARGAFTNACAGHEWSALSLQPQGATSVCLWISSTGQRSAHRSFIENEAGGWWHIVCLASPRFRAVTSQLLLHLVLGPFTVLCSYSVQQDFATWSRDGSVRGDGEEGRHRPSGGRKAQSSWEAEQLTRQSAETADGGRDQRGKFKRPTRGAAATREDSGVPPPPPPPPHAPFLLQGRCLHPAPVPGGRIMSKNRILLGWSVRGSTAGRPARPCWWSAHSEMWCSLCELAGLDMVLPIRWWLAACRHASLRTSEKDLIHCWLRLLAKPSFLASGCVSSS